MAEKNTVFGIFRDRERVEKAVDRLLENGFHNDDISVLLPDQAMEMARAKTKAPRGAGAGLATGAVVGGALGLLAGIGALAIPGIGPLIAGGPIVGALAGVGGGGVVGGLAGGLVGLGIPAQEAGRYEGLLKRGGALLAVRCDDWNEVNRAKDLLKQAGADDISTAKETGAMKREQPVSVSGGGR